MAPPTKGSPKPAAPEPVAVRLPITLGQFLKVAALASSGGEAKAVIALGSVRVNGLTETRRGHKLEPGDVVQFGAGAARVAAIDDPARDATTDVSAGVSTNAAP